MRGIDELAAVYFAGNLTTSLNIFCVLGSMVTSEDGALVTLQHRTTLAWGQFWNLKDQLRSRESSMKSRVALLHLAVRYSSGRLRLGPPPLSLSWQSDLCTAPWSNAWEATKTREAVAGMPPENFSGWLGAS